jgi:hypothetical protein
MDYFEKKKKHSWEARDAGCYREWREFPSSPKQQWAEPETMGKMGIGPL